MAAGEFSPIAVASPRRVVLLGASNLTRGLATAIDTARAVWGSPLEVIIAAGHGRSYGMSSAVLGRQLPGILQCRLWPALAARPPAPTAALITDVGNDILYGASPPAILGWIGQCLDRLAASDVRVTLTLLPLATVARLGHRRFLLLRTCLVPRCRLSLADVLSRGREVDAGLRELAAARRLACVAPRAEWFGFDPIHLRRRSWNSAWREMLGAWCEATSDRANVVSSLVERVRVRLLAPDERRLFGVALRRAQPAGRLRDGTTIALY